MLGYAAAVVVTTVVVTIGTDPFSVYHFHHIALYSPLANVVAVPLSAVWTLPWGVVSCLLMPFGLERLALIPMGWGIDATIFVARGVSALPGNVWPMPRLPAAGLALISFGGLWLCLWRQPWRRWGIAAIAAGLVGMALTRPPDIVLADLGRFLAVRSPDGAYWSAADHGEQIQASFLRAETGLDVLPWPPADESRALGCANRCVDIRRGGGVSRSLPGPRHCRSIAAALTRLSAKFRRGSVAAPSYRLSIGSMPGGSAASPYGLANATSRSTAPMAAAVTAHGCRIPVPDAGRQL